MSDPTVKLKLQILQEGLQNLTQAIDGLEKTGTSASDLKDRARQLAGELDRLQAAQDEATTASEEQAKSVDDVGRALDGLDLTQAIDGLEKTGVSASDLKDRAAELTAQLDRLKTEQTQAGSSSEAQAKAVEDAGRSLDDLKASLQETQAAQQKAKTSIDEKTQSIKAALTVEQSEIELQRQALNLEAENAKAALQAAQASGSASAQRQAANQLRAIETQQLDLIARGKRAEAAATEQAVEARRSELAALGQLTPAMQQELLAAENHAKALRLEADASEVAARSARAQAANVDDLGERTRKVSALLGEMAGALGVAFSFRELVTAAAEMESLRAGLTAVSGDALKAGKDLEYVRDVANRVGADVAAVGNAYLSLSASTKGTAVEGEATRQVFEAVAVAMAKAGKSTAETGNALLALSQMASKGQVQMEELKGQLGEALPGALNAVAKGLGITTQDLQTLVESGQLAASDVFPALTNGLNEIYGTAPAAKTLSQEIANIGNSFKQMSEDIGNAGGLSALKVGAQLAQSAIVLMDAALVAAGQKIGALASAIATANFSHLSEIFQEIEAEAQDKLLKAAQHNDVLRSALAAVGKESVQAALAQQQQTKASEASGKAAEAQISSIIKLNIAYANSVKVIDGLIDKAVASQAAREAEGKATVAIATALGTEAEKRTAAAKAAKVDADQSAEVARLRTAEVTVLKAQEKAITDAMAAEGKSTDQQQKALLELQKNIQAKQSAADKSVAEAQASRLLAEQTAAESEALKDNSARVNELRGAYASATSQLQALRSSQAAGKATQEQVTQAELNAAHAASLYRDALADQVKAVEAKGRAQQAEYSLDEAVIQLAIEQQKAIQEVAIARGDEKTATEAGNQIRRLEIQLLELQAEAKRAEAKAELAAVEAKKASLLASGQLTEAEKAELEAATASAKAKQLEADIAVVTANKMRALADAQQKSKDASKEAADGYSGESDALQGLNESLQRTISLKNSLRNVDANGFARDKTGKITIAAEGATYASLVSALKSYGLDDAKAQQVARQFLDGNGNVPAVNNPGQRQYGGSTLSDALQQAAQQALYGKDASSASQAARSASAAGSSSSASSTSSTTTKHVVEINFGTTSGSVNVASEADATTLTNLLKQLQTAAARAS